MVETFYVHMEFLAENGNWSINLPFVCTRCGVCCTVDDFLTAGEVKAKPEEQPEVHAKLKALYDKLGKLLELGEDKYDDHIMHTPCPFLSGKSCSIYAIRPDGCRQFPNTPFGMLTQDCEALTRFKKQCATLSRGRTTKRTYFFTIGPIRKSKLNQKQLQSSVAKLRKTGITEEELTLLGALNR
jgi:Fe-S-cluster containining protein